MYTRFIHDLIATMNQQKEFNGKDFFPIDSNLFVKNGSRIIKMHDIHKNYATLSYFFNNEKKDEITIHYNELSLTHIKQNIKGLDEITISFYVSEDGFAELQICEYVANYFKVFE